MERGAEGEAAPADRGEHVTAGQGAALGGLAGLLMGAAAMLIPGIGPLVAIGPITAALTGAVTGGVTGAVVGGIAGGLIRAGVSEEEAHYYESRVKQGGVLLAVHTDEARYPVARQILARHGADVRGEDAAAADGGAAAPTAGGWDRARARYRADWEQRYADRGGRWEDYEPGYRYGWEMSSRSEYHGRSWAEIEPELRRDWETRHRDKPWDRAADAVRDAWESVRR